MPPNDSMFWAARILFQMNETCFVRRASKFCRTALGLIASVSLSGVCAKMNARSAHRQMLKLLLGSATGALVLMFVLQHVFAPEKAMFDPLAYICSTADGPGTVIE